MTQLICPFDALPLNVTATGAQCPHGHHFDRAKEGYFNLLPVQAKQSKDPGDSPLMVQARRAFLNSGHYKGFIDQTREMITQILNGRTAPVILDAGCGEGYYLNRFQTHPALAEASLVGIDISKHAIKAAAKSSRTISWLVASNRHVPFPDQSVDVILCAFGFPVWPEFQRILKPDGCVICIDPAETHLIELRQALYPTLKSDAKDYAPPQDWMLQDTLHHHSSFKLDQPDAVRSLIAMTPHQHRAPQSAIDAACQDGFPHLTAAVNIRILKPH